MKLIKLVKQLFIALTASSLLIFSLMETAYANQLARFQRHGAMTLLLRPQLYAPMVRNTYTFALNYWQGFANHYPMVARTVYNSAQSRLLDTTVNTVSGVTNAISRRLFSSVSTDLTQIPNYQLILADTETVSKTQTAIQLWQQEFSAPPIPRYPIDVVRGGQTIIRDISFSQAPWSSSLVSAGQAPRIMNIYAHGDEYRVEVPGELIKSVWRSKTMTLMTNHFADFLQQNAVYQEALANSGNRLVIRLMICSAGGTTEDGSLCLAEGLSNQLNKMVIAPSHGILTSSPPYDLLIFEDSDVNHGIINKQKPWEPGPLATRWKLFIPNNYDAPYFETEF